MRSTTMVLFFAALPLNALAYSTGISASNWGYNNTAGCMGCHSNGVGRSTPALVSFTGPGGTLDAGGTLSADAGVTGLYTLVIDVGNATAAGITVTPYSPNTTDAGTLSLCTGTNCTGLQVLTGGTYGPQISHTSPKAKDASNRVTYAFNYQPMGSECASQVQAYVLGSNGIPSTMGDQGARFIFTINSDGLPCDDGDLCTVNSVCTGGVCGGGTPVTCAALDQCHDVGTCNPGTGVCSTPTKMNGTLCDDGNLCTPGDSCIMGVCTGGVQPACTALDGCHTAGVCDPATGVCTNPVKNDGSACSDNNACTQTDTCVDGGCTGANPITCAAIDECHDAGVCDTGTGMCTTPAVLDGTECADGSKCTLGDSCVSGVCVPGAPLDCAASDDCHDAGVCDPSTGTCSNPGVPDGTMCSIGLCESAVCTAVDGGTGGGAGGGGGSAAGGGAATGGGSASGGGSATGGGPGTGGGTAATGGGSTATGGGSSTGGGGMSSSGCGCDSTFGSVGFAALAVLMLRRRRR